MKRYYVLLIVMMLSHIVGRAEKQGFAIYESETGILTFKYGEKPAGDNVYDTDYTDFNFIWPSYPLWDCSSLKKVIFDSSYVNASPHSTALWFYNAESLTEIIDIKYLNTNSVTDMTAMFYGCSNLTSLDVSNFNTSNVISMFRLFYGCSGLTTLDVSNFNTSNVTSFDSMFEFCSNLTTIDLSSFNTKKVTTMAQMFCNCNSLASLDISNFDTSNVTSMHMMFSGCNSLTYLDVSNFNTGNVTDMYAMFSSCYALTSLDVGHFETSKVTTMYWMFNRCRGLSNIDVTNFKTGQVTDMRSMFGECTSLTSLDLKNFNTENVKTMENMFDNCEGLTSLDLSSFDTRNVTNMRYMFHGCSGLTSINVSNFNTGNVSNMANMFYGCKGFKNLDLSNFNTSNVTNMDWMFRYCNNLTTITVGNAWTTVNVKTSEEMFESCYNLVGGKDTKFDRNHTDHIYARIDGGASSPGYLTDKMDQSQEGAEPSSINIGEKRLLSITREEGSKIEQGLFKYDNLGRVIEYNCGKQKDLYTYTDNSIEIVEGNDKYSYTISDGKIVSGHTFLDGDYVEIDRLFSYNSDNHLISIVNKETERGASGVWTIIDEWEWASDNPLSRKCDDEEDVETYSYSYSNLKSEPIVLSLFGFNNELHLDDIFEIIAIYPYLGKQPNNLFENVIYNDSESRTYNYTYSYERNSNDDIVKVMVVSDMKSIVYTLKWADSEESSGINNISIDQLEHGESKYDVYYNLHGERVETPQKGIYIHNGRKIITK